ncbi:thiosulfate sulfurtransferase/rhodanese-like domain-containing protein 2 isoform X2 [Cynoglossus semilaevis]|uniref:thiosulfate sulfurtransferase/rhodanese-like domain-containing protein 2 isoform X2 n=1 Tax=Cynoglossus semilaevis TaxID=244447 RepID=UPI000D626D8D|nr:thiosulfate sulfurtransferase/rhodanese-like domain-containing protein 2 isoform X2 [Cynoglossus semilaevis]
MTSGSMNTTEFLDLELDTQNCDEVKQEKTLPAGLRKYYNFCRRKSFATFVKSKRESSQNEGSSSWFCCNQIFKEHTSIHKHVAKCHNAEIKQLTLSAYECLLNQLEKEAESMQPKEQKADDEDVSAWIPNISHISEELLQKGPGKVLLYYHYCKVENPHVVWAWQKALCEKLHLTGKVRVATEGINGTVGGTDMAIDVYISAMCSFPVFKMDKDDFKTSDGGAKCFTDLRVGVYKEIVPMGVNPEVITYESAGLHLEPEEFHKEVEDFLTKGDLCNNTVLLDCRNFYESKIGQFTNCLAPDIRGIRCERASAYLRSKEVCKEVYQLKGGIHKYLERFPDGFYRGKLFVFDERYTISSNTDVISDCRYCGRPWDQYQLCSTQLCYQLVLSCPSCREDELTACCPTCQTKGQTQSLASTAPHLKEECECTDRRPRIPQDV